MAVLLLRHLGWRWAAFRLRYAWQARSGALRRATPPMDWDAAARHTGHTPGVSLGGPESARFFLEPGPPPAGAGFEPAAAIADADAIITGTFPYFHDRRVQAGFPPDWHRDPLGGAMFPAAGHWSRIPDFAKADIKLVWELSRCAWAFTLVRAHRFTGDTRYAEAFWTLLEDWRRCNPPNCGVHWKCGQETSFRVMAWITAGYAFARDPATTPARAGTLAGMLAVSGARIAANFDYALSQNNNHGISEAAVLWTLGLLLPGLHDAPAWRRRGRMAIEQQVAQLVYGDGAFSQHSANYHRVMLHDLLWVLRLADLNGERFSPGTHASFARAAHFLDGLLDPDSGGVPNYGGADGALVLPLDACPWGDYRSVLQAAWIQAEGKRRFPPGPWDESVFHLFGVAALGTPADTHPRTDRRGGDGGQHVLRAADGMAAIRCGSFRHRPAHADLLHADLWWRGINLALDAGTYSYHAPPPWDHDLAGTAVHNTLRVDDVDQMERTGRFLWLPWVRGQVLTHVSSPEGRYTCWAGMHDGYMRLRRPVAVHRTVLCLGGAWVVIDRAQSDAPHRYALQWLLADFPHTLTLRDADTARLTLATTAGPYAVEVGAWGVTPHVTLVRAEATGIRGWRATAYGHRAPALSLEATAQAPSCTFWSVFAPEPCTVRADADTLQIQWAARTCCLRVAGDHGPTRITTLEEGGATWMLPT